MKTRLKAIDDAKNVARVNATQLDAMTRAAACVAPVLDALTLEVELPKLATQFGFDLKPFRSTERELKYVAIDAAPAILLQCNIQNYGDEHVLTCTARDELGNKVRIKRMQSFRGALREVWTSKNALDYELSFPNWIESTVDITATLMNGSCLRTLCVTTNAREVLEQKLSIPTESCAQLCKHAKSNYMSDDGAFVLRLDDDSVTVLDMATLSEVKSYAALQAPNIYTCATWKNRTAYVFCSNGKVLIDDMDWDHQPVTARLNCNWPIAAMTQDEFIIVAFKARVLKYNLDFSLFDRIYGTYGLPSARSDGRSFLDNDGVRIGRYDYGIEMSRGMTSHCRAVCAELDDAVRAHRVVFYVASLDHLCVFTLDHVYIYKINV